MISAILLSAGQSRRMHGENKLVKKVKGIPLIKHSIKNILNSSVDDLIIILGHQKELLEKFGCEVTELYCELDGNFPNHEANPEELENMLDLIKKVKEWH